MTTMIRKLMWWASATAFGVAAGLALWLTLAPIIGSQWTARPPTVHTTYTPPISMSVAATTTSDYAAPAPRSACPDNDGSGLFHDCAVPINHALTDEQRTMAAMFCGEVFANQTAKGVWDAVTSLTDLHYTAKDVSHIIFYAVNTVCPGAKSIVDETILGTSSSASPTTTPAAGVGPLHVS